MKALLARHGVLVFMAVRQDVLRWGLSKYHGSGDGKGHLQFKLASGQISRDEIGRIRVDFDRLGKIIDACEQSHEQKRALVGEFEAAGIACAPLRYEDFLADKPAYFRRLCGLIGLKRSDADVRAALENGAYFEKVHSDDISSFVENHEEVMARFGDRFVRWD